MDAEWIRYWLRCLRMNDAYKAYCLAKREKDEAAARQIEQAHPKIAEVYIDFGDLHAIHFARFWKNWDAWLDQHRHLFYPTSTTVGRTTTTTQPKYQLANERKGPYQLRAMRKRFTAWLHVAERNGKRYSAMRFVKNVLDDRCHLGAMARDWDDWGGDRNLNYKQLTLKLRKEAQAIIHNTANGVFPVTR